MLVVVASSLGALLTERAIGRGGALADGSAVITGLLLGLTLPAGLDRPLRYAKYPVLAAILVASLYMAFPPLREFCPVRAVFGLRMTGLLWTSLIIFLAGSVLVERFWCKYLCPLGAVLAIFN